MAGIRDEDILLFAPAQKTNKKSQAAKERIALFEII